MNSVMRININGVGFDNIDEVLFLPLKEWLWGIYRKFKWKKTPAFTLSLDAFTYAIDHNLLVGVIDTKTNERYVGEPNSLLQTYGSCIMEIKGVELVVIPKTAMRRVRKDGSPILKQITFDDLGG